MIETSKPVEPVTLAIMLTEPSTPLSNATKVGHFLSRKLSKLTLDKEILGCRQIIGSHCIFLYYCHIPLSRLSLAADSSSFMNLTYLASA